MNNILSEKEYQHEIMGYLRDANGYRVRKATDYDRLFAVDRGMLFEFLDRTQPDRMTELRKIFKADTEQTGTLAGAVVTAADALSAPPRGRRCRPAPSGK